MTIARVKYVIITRNRPTRFLTSTGELSESFDDALILNDITDVEAEMEKLDERGSFIATNVRLSTEV